LAAQLSPSVGDAPVGVDGIATFRGARNVQAVVEESPTTINGLYREVVAV
jgi:hypothetical protein